jgi:Putative peptidoglycan binding domain
MKTKYILFFSCFVAVMLAASVATAGMHGGARGGGTHSMSMPARGGHPFVPNGMGRFSGQRWNGQHWNGGNWHHHHHDHDDFNNVVFIGGFPFWGWGWGWGYPYYGYYPPYGYYPYGYYGTGYYGAGYGYGYGNRSRVAGMQRQLAHAGYYHGAIDGIMGPRTRRALQAYQRDHRGMGAYGRIDRQPITTMMRAG